MISFLRGRLLDKSDKELVIDVQGVGYAVFVTSETSNQYKIADEVNLFTYLNVKEDSLKLFAFRNKEERSFFENLLKVSGVGPKMAMEILEAPIGQIKKAICDKNDGFLSQIKGLGKKTAQKIILELSSKISLEELQNENQNPSSMNEDVFFALQNLGFSQKEIFVKLKELPNEINEMEDIVRWFLKK